MERHVHESDRAGALGVLLDWKSRVLKATDEAIQTWLTPVTLNEPDVVRFATWISIWGRWFVWLLLVFLLAYRPDFWYPHHVEFIAMPIAQLLINGLVQYRLLAKRPITQRLLFLCSASDVAQIIFAVVILGGYSSFAFLGFYPALGLFAVLFSALWVTLAWTSVAAVIYVSLCLWIGGGLDLELGQEKVLVARVATMYIVAVGIGMLIRYERLRWQSALSRAQQLRRERIELSQQIHDTTAQTAFMINLGIHRAQTLAEESNKELLSALEATASLSKSAMWEMRGPIDAGHIVEGRELGLVLSSHCATFELITGIPTTLSQTDTEPSLPIAIRTRLFSIVHNALTNAFLHAGPSRVEVSLSFVNEEIVLNVMDDGIGLPDDHARRGRGISGMMEDAVRMGGTLRLNGANAVGGTTITCVVPQQQNRGGD
ncbi:MAG: ATP-binding protein [Chloroflexi bacterium]|nr:ATP-binding protein [Chloroflexota bacterium]